MIRFPLEFDSVTIFVFIIHITFSKCCSIHVAIATCFAVGLYDCLPSQCFSYWDKILLALFIKFLSLNIILICTT